VGDLANGSEVTLTITATVGNVGTMNSQASVSSDQRDPNTTNNNDQVNLTVNIVPVEEAAPVVQPEPVVEVVIIPEPVVIAPVEALPIPELPAPEAVRETVTGNIETVSGFNDLGQTSDPSGDDHALSLDRNIPEQTLQPGGDGLNFTIPADTFTHTDPNATLTMTASMVDGTPLPTWLSFDPATGAFSGTPPDNLSGELQVKVVARDDAGRQVETVVRMSAPAPVASAEAAINNAVAEPAAAAPASTPLAEPTAAEPATAPVETAPAETSTPAPARSASAPAAEPAAAETPAAGVQQASEATDRTGNIATTSGFAVRVVETAQSGGEHQFNVDKAIPDQVFSSSNASINYTVPVDAFVHTDSGAQVTLAAVMVDGSALPTWLSFDANKGEFTGTAPAGFEGALIVKIIARDDDGRQAETTLTIRVGEKADSLTQKGKPAFSAQLKAQGVFAWKAERDNLIKHARDAGLKARADGLKAENGKMAKGDTPIPPEKVKASKVA